MEWARVQRHGGLLSLIMADIDFFKQVNDTYGHGTGDRLLQQVAKAIASQCRQTDLPARYGGDEFASIVPDEKASTAACLADRCRQAIEGIRLDVGQDTVQTTASFGVADALGLSSEEALIRSADEALYRAKQAGRNRVELASQSRQAAKSKSGIAS